jgi:hypothetical protein
MEKLLHPAAAGGLAKKTQRLRDPPGKGTGHERNRVATGTGGDRVVHSSIDSS